MPGDDTTDVRAGKEISIEMTERSFLPGKDNKYIGTFAYSLGMDAGSSTTECSLVPGTSRNRVTISFTWPDNYIPPTPPMEEKETAVFRKEYEVYGSGDAMYFQNEEHFFNRIQIDVMTRSGSGSRGGHPSTATLFNRDGKEIGTFFWRVKSRKSIVRRATFQVQNVLTTRRNQLKQNDLTIISFGYLVLAEWSTTIATFVALIANAKSNAKSIGSHLMVALIVWFSLQSALTYAAVSINGKTGKWYKLASWLLCPQAICMSPWGSGTTLLFGCILYITGTILFGMPLKLLGCRHYKPFMEGAMEIGQEFVLGCFALATAAAGIFSCFAGTIYLLTTPYTTIGLIITFGVLPLVVWPVAYIVVGATVGLPVRPPCRRCGGSLFLCVLGMALFNLILPASLMLFYDGVKAAPPPVVDKECVTLQHDLEFGPTGLGPTCNGKIIYEQQTQEDLLPSDKNQCDCKPGYVREGWFVCSKKAFISNQTCTKCPNSVDVGDWKVDVGSEVGAPCLPYCKEGYSRHIRLDQNNRTMFIPSGSEYPWYECRRCTNTVGIRRYITNTCDAASCVTGNRTYYQPTLHANIICESIPVNGSSTNGSSTNGSSTNGSR